MAVTKPSILQRTIHIYHNNNRNCGILRQGDHWDITEVVAINHKGGDIAADIVDNNNEHIKNQIMGYNDPDDDDGNGNEELPIVTMALITIRSDGAILAAMSNHTWAHPSTHKGDPYIPFLSANTHANPGIQSEWRQSSTWIKRSLWMNGCNTAMACYPFILSAMLGHLGWSCIGAGTSSQMLFTHLPKILAITPCIATSPHLGLTVGPIGILKG